MMTKNETIEAICKLNPTADPAFLSGFAPDDLSDYLRRLSSPACRRTFTAADAWDEVSDDMPTPEFTVARAPTE